jgi:hypothetical protein
VKQGADLSGTRAQQAARFGPEAVRIAHAQLPSGAPRELEPADVDLRLLNHRLETWQIELIHARLPPAWARAADAMKKPTVAKYLNLVAELLQQGAAGEVIADPADPNTTTGPAPPANHGRPARPSTKSG